MFFHYHPSFHASGIHQGRIIFWGLFWEQLFTYFLNVSLNYQLLCLLLTRLNNEKMGFFAGHLNNSGDESKSDYEQQDPVWSAFVLFLSKWWFVFSENICCYSFLNLLIARLHILPKYPSCWPSCFGILCSFADLEMCDNRCRWAL